MARASANSQIRFAAQAFLLKVAFLFAPSFCGIGYRASVFPRLLIPRGTIPSHALNSRPLREAAPLPIAAMMAVAVTGPTPGDRNQSSAGFVLASRLPDHRIGFVDSGLQVIELQPQLRQQHAQSGHLEVQTEIPG
jgi:hypothetical protein